MSTNKVKEGELYLPASLDAKIIRDAEGRCWARTSIISTDGDIGIQDTELFTVDQSALCCENCISNLETDYSSEFIYTTEIDVTVDITTEDPIYSSSSSSSSELSDDTLTEAIHFCSCDSFCNDSTNIVGGSGYQYEFEATNAANVNCFDVCDGASLEECNILHACVYPYQDGLGDWKWEYKCCCISNNSSSSSSSL